MTTMTMNVSEIFGKMKGCQGLLTTILEYDDTYKCIFSKDIITELWRYSWYSWFSKIKCPYEKAVAGFLLETWGIYEGHTCFSDNRWFKHNYFPDSISIHKCLNLDNGRMMVSVRMIVPDMRSVTIFRGMVLTQSQYKEECGEETGNVLMYLDVFEDTDTGFVVYNAMQ